MKTEIEFEKVAEAGWKWFSRAQQQARISADLLEALQDTIRYLVTPAGLPDVGKGRTAQQQISYDKARKAIARAEGKY